jgi:glycosyltransferase involved in cell wall biosynthesis
MARILIVNSRYWPAASGSERWLTEIAQRWAADGHGVEVATTDGLGADAAWNPRAARARLAREQRSGVAIRRFPLRYLPGSPTTYALWRYALFPALIRLPVSDQRLLAWARFTPWCPALTEWLASQASGFDWVVGANVLAEGLLAAAREAAARHGARLGCVPFTHLGAGSSPGADSVGRMYTMRQQRRIVTGADRILAMTPTERTFYLDQGAAPERVHVVGAGINPHECVAGDGRRWRARHGWEQGPVVVYLAPLHGDKGLWQVVSAAERLWPDQPDLRLALVGTVFPASRLRLQAVQRARPRHVVVLPSVSEADKHDLLAAADALVMPSRTDSFGIVFLEAWAQGTPVIGATAWGMRDVITPGVDGDLVPFGDAGALADLLARWFADPALRQRLGQAGRHKTLTTLTWDGVYQRVRAALGT